MAAVPNSELADSSPSTPGSSESAGGANWRRWSRKVPGPVLALLAVVAFFTVVDGLLPGPDSYCSTNSFRVMATNCATVAMAALGMTVIIIAGGIDLSAGTAIALCATVFAWCLKEDVAVRLLTGTNEPAVKARLTKAEDEVRKLTAKAADAPPEKQPGLREQLRERQAEAEQLASRLEDVSQTTRRWHWLTPWLALTLTMGCGCATGVVNGALICRLNNVPFVITLGTMMIYLGLAKLVANNTTIHPTPQQIPTLFATLLSPRNDFQWWGVPVGVWLLLVLAIGLAAVLHYTVFGRHVFAIGSNEATARLCGVHVQRTKICVYAIGGFFVGMAGLCWFSRQNAGTPTSGGGLELNVIAAVVLGGGSLSGGRGSVVGTLAGAATIAAIQSGCTCVGFSNAVQDMVLGAILIFASTLDVWRRRRVNLV